MQNTTVYLKEYKPSSFGVASVDLFFDLYEDEALVRAKTRFIRQHAGPLHLFGDSLELISVQRDDQVLNPSDYKLSKDALIIDSCPDEFTLDLVTRIRPQDNTALSGLYRSNALFCTQCEAEGFRRITYFLDRPDVLTQYTTRICADKKRYPVLLSNGNLIDSGEDEEGRHWVTWQDPFKKPSYLFALVAGDLVFIQDKFLTCSGREIDLRIYVAKGAEDKCHFAMESLKKAMRWDEEVYGREYDLDIFMIVAISDFNMGAMENKGLNLFNAKYILARPDTASDEDFTGIESVVAHEYFHNWTGNRVTCRDWFQLSLKEGLTVFREQEFSRAMNSPALFRIHDVDILRQTQFPEDASAMAHPVRPDSYQEINNFYTATIYNKGAEIIRMQHTLLGKEGFRRGMDLYFQRHDGQAVTIDDFVAAMEDANEVDLTQFKLWYVQAGTPIVQVSAHFSEGKLHLTLEQSCPPTPDGLEKKPLHIPLRLAFFDAKGKRMKVEQDLLELKESKQSFVFENLSEKPIISVLREFSAPVRIKDELTSEELLVLFQHETDGFAQWEAGKRLVLNHLNASMQQTKPIPEPLMAAMKHLLLKEGLDLRMRAELIKPPSFEDLTAQMKLIDVDQVERVRDSYRKELGLGLYDEAKQLYQLLWQEEEGQMNSIAYGRRALKNMCLHLMMKAREVETLALCQQQFTAAKTMTDQLAAFTLLAHCSDKSIRKQAIQDFYQQWQHEDLVVEKWFAIQAASELPGTLLEVKKLTEHSAFTLTNPNKVRSLIGVFCTANPRSFHALDGSGYAFLKEMLIQMDALNPQTTARLATPFTRWARFNTPRQLLMKQQLEQLAKEKLSSDLGDLISRSLKNQ